MASFRTKSEKVAAIRQEPTIQPASGVLTGADPTLTRYVQRLTRAVEHLQSQLDEARALAKQAHEDIRTVAQNAEANFAALERSITGRAQAMGGLGESFSPRRQTAPGGGFFRPSERRVDPRLIETEGIVDAETLDLSPQEIDVTPGGW